MALIRDPFAAERTNILLFDISVRTNEPSELIDIEIASALPLVISTYIPHEYAKEAPWYITIIGISLEDEALLLVIPLS